MSFWIAFFLVVCYYFKNVQYMANALLSKYI